MTDPNEETRASDESPRDSRSSDGGAHRLGELESLSVGTGSGEYLARFRILEEISRGGMGTVYRDHDSLLSELDPRILAPRVVASPRRRSQNPRRLDTRLNARDA